MKNWRKVFTEEELNCIIEFCNKKIENFEKFKKKFPLQGTKRADPIDASEYKNMIHAIQTNSKVSTFMFTELYCWCGNKKKLGTIEKSIEKKCDFEIRKKEVNFYEPKTKRRRG